MATIVTRVGKGSPLTHVEVDDNFTGLNNELAQKEVAANKGVANGYASLDGGAKVPAAQLPSYVDDVIEVANFASLPVSGETGKIYVTLDTNKTYRWSGSAYIEISASPGSTDAVTEGSTNLYFTNTRSRSAISVSGSLAYDSTTGVLSFSDAVTSVAGKTGAVTLANSDVGLGNVENKSSATIRGELTSGNVTTALGFTPYNSTNPSGYTSNTGTVTSVSGTGTVSGITLSGSVTGSGSLTLGGTLSLTSGQVTTALGYTPYNSSNPSGYITSGGRAYPRRSDGGDLNFYWSGQGGQPPWLWGGSDGANMYVYNPSNFSVNYANSAGSAGSVAASGISGQVGMWTSGARPGPYRLYRRDSDDAYNVQTYWTGARWRLLGYLGDGYHAEAEVQYSNSTGYLGGTFDSSGRCYSREWIELPNLSGLYSPINNAHFLPNGNSYGSWRSIGARNGWGGIEFNHGNDSGHTTLMMNADTYGFHYNGVGWRFYVSGASGYFPGNVVAYWSDERLKCNLQRIDREALDILGRFRAHRFNWNELVETYGLPIAPGKEELGLIAQHVQRALPDAVVVNKAANKVAPDGSQEELDYLTINYDKITPLLVEGVNIHEEEISGLKAEIAELKELVRKLTGEKNGN